MAGPDVSILIISYNTRELTLACLSSVYAQTRGVSFDVIVVDNHSQDESADQIETLFPQTRLLAEKENHGFARANNIAAAKATGEYLLLLNPDTVVLDGAVQKLLAFAKSNPRAGIVGGRTLYPDGSLNPTCCWGKPTLWSTLLLTMGISAIFNKSGVLNPEAMGGWQRDSARDVDIITGCFLLIRHDLWSQLDGFDEAFFMYGEEADLCLRASRAKVICRYTPSATIVHYDGASERVSSSRKLRLFRARAQLLRKHWSPVSAAVGIRMLDLWALSRMLAFGTLGILWRVFRQSYGQWRDVWHQRRAWHTTFLIPPERVSDVPAPKVPS